VPLVLFSPIGVAINQSLVAEIVAGAPIDILVTVNVSKTSALPGKYRKFETAINPALGNRYIDIPGLILAPLTQDEKAKVLPNAVKGALILQV
jgi:hypothetical protein